MNDISISYTIGSEIKQLKIEFTNDGAGQIRLDKRYHGQVVFSQDKWNVYLNDKSELKNSEDIQALIQILSELNEHLRNR